MRINMMALFTMALAAALAAPPASAKTLRSNVAFNTGIGKKTASQPMNGVQVAYQITLKGGDLDGCKVDVIEDLHPRNEGAWGIFDIAGKVNCADGGGFAYTSSGSWDGKGFHAAGTIVDGSGTGRFQGAKGRVAQLGGAGSSKGDGTNDIAYELVVDTVEA